MMKTNFQITKRENVYSFSRGLDRKKISFASYPKFKGVEVDIKFFDEKDKFLLFENIPIEVTVNLYTKNKNKLVWSGRSKISSYVETTSLGGERLKIPVGDIKKTKGGPN